jgi:hypothetical protein
VVKGGRDETLSATTFAELTGVSRERLRTWERRFGFPAPQRVGGGRRRYRIADASSVVAVRRMATDGVPLEHAIESARFAAELGSPVGPPPVEDLSRAAAQLPVPLMLVSGPAPMRVRYVNEALAAADGPSVGEELAAAAAWFTGSELEQELARLFASEGGSASCVHPAWPAARSERVQSVLYRIRSDSDLAGLIAIAQLERPATRQQGLELAELRERYAGLELRLARHDRWLVAIGELADLWQHATGEELLSSMSDTMVKRLPPIDTGVAVYMGGELAIGSSNRGMLGPAMVTVTGHSDLSAVLREQTPAWLGSASGAAFGAAEGLHLLAVPITVLGETLGALMFVCDGEHALDDDLMQLLTVLSAATGFALLRDRMLEGARVAGGGPGSAVSG